MLESLQAFRNNALPSPIPTSRPSRNITRALDDNDEPPPLEPLDSSSSDSESLLSRDTPPPTPASSISSLSPAPNGTTTATSRFSPIVGNRSQERVLIDLASDDENDEIEDQSTDSEVADETRIPGQSHERVRVERNTVNL